MRPHVKIATPCYGGLVTQLYMLSVVRLLREGPDLGFDVSLSLLGGDALVSRARATLVAAFMDAPEATHLLFVDADISFEPDQVRRLLDADKDFCGAFYPVKTVDWSQLPRRCVEGGEPLQTAGLSYVGTLCQGEALRQDGRFATALYAGGGFQMVRRGAVERMFAAYPATRFRSTHTYPAPAVASPNLYALFESLIDPVNGAYISEDYAFCRRWRDLGGEIWLDLDSRLTHTGPQSFAGDFAVRAAGGLPLEA
ncbi:hypothetical protein [Magnetospirillum molischianum]|uniref:Glycosyltransferase n=1 Tax=Magnetospirillum molischianum DSM 120 TaxID=1150626 RepID=H8FMZ6_MAGML|nr:hypothetical protein [Magnetospirillum molischianum]CCG39734.1 conserved hypothetical protein [Magnetospirillum molischianum DSM 120]